jgi:hypothetical protein
VNSTDFGTTISSITLSANACLSIRDNFDPDSNVSDVSDPHLRRQPSPMNSTDFGIAISSITLSANACLSIRDNFVPDSNVSKVSDPHSRKQPSHCDCKEDDHSSMIVFSGVRRISINSFEAR